MNQTQPLRVLPISLSIKPSILSNWSLNPPLQLARLYSPTTIMATTSTMEITKSPSSDVSLTTTTTTNHGELLDLYGNKFQLPDYTIKQIYDAIPPECFERNVFKSMSYVVQDIALIVVTFLVFHNYVTPAYIPSYWLRFTLWTL